MEGHMPSSSSVVKGHDGILNSRGFLLVEECAGRVFDSIHNIIIKFSTDFLIVLTFILIQECSTISSFIPPIYFLFF